MTMYVMEVQAQAGTAVEVGQHVRRGQKIGLARDARTEVVSPADGVVRAVEFNRFENNYTVNVISRDDHSRRDACSG